MAEQLYERINEVAAVTINLASPEDIRSWSSGEVKKPETINYRTYKPEKDGLFCEKIFGPEKDYECSCGKHRGIKYKGIVCDKCGVKVTTAKVRRKRMGHIDLTRKDGECIAPVAHIWFFKATPSRLSALLDMKTSALEKVIYFQEYAVVEPGPSGLADNETLSEERYREMKQRYGDEFDAGMGAEAIRRKLRRLDLAGLSVQLRQELSETKSRQKGKDLFKRLKTVEALRDSGNKPEWMILEVIPVIPPDLRPLVLLDSGNFATSDLNDLYRRLINRNNRLKKLIDVNAPEVIIRNEKRMLQQAADALFDNGRCRRPVVSNRNRPTKSLTDMIKGKQGRFRENLLGKRVDYSGRSVIVVEPALKLHQCGLPKKIALELFQPFIIRRLKEKGLAETIKSAKKMLERKDEEVWDILEEVTQNHPVLLNRAPTLHRMGIQAFEPVLVEGNAIKLHPLVCAGFNADFDGDQMAVHLPLSFEAQIEAHTLMLSVHNVFSPANGRPIIAPSQDMVLGIYYLTTDHKGEKGEGNMYHSLGELLAAYSYGKVGLHAKVRVVMPPRMVVYNDKDTAVSGHTGRTKEDWLHTDRDADGKSKWLPNLTGAAPFDAIEQYADKHCRPFIVETTPGRVLFNDILPRGLPFFNYSLDKGKVADIIDTCYKRLGRIHTLRLLDDIKEIGFKAATRGGLSIAKGDMITLKEKPEILAETQKKVDDIEQNFRHGAITDRERRKQVIDQWSSANERISKFLITALADDKRDGKPYLNPIHMMVTSKARGSQDQVRQLAGMRGLMAKPGGDIIETPIKANFKEGLRVLEYFSSTHGARKGLADTALKTADSGYLTRKLADVAQHVVIRENDCGTKHGVTKTAIVKGERVEVSLADQIIGRVSLDNLKHPQTEAVIVPAGGLITPAIAEQIEAAKFPRIRLRSPLTCETEAGMCQKCYGADMSRGNLVELGMAVGIIAAQSIGEPGTQLTMRTFHVGGVATTQAEESDIKATKAGVVEFAPSLEVASLKDGTLVSMRRRGEVHVKDKGAIAATYQIPHGAMLRVKNGQEVKPGTVLCEWDNSARPILCEFDGRIRYRDLIEGKTFKDHRNQKTKQTEREVTEHRGGYHPQLNVEDSSGAVLGYYPLPERAIITVKDGDSVTRGTIIAKEPREVGSSQDITGGLPRVTELLEARRNKVCAVLAECDGAVVLSDEVRRSKRTVIVRMDDGTEKEHLVPKSMSLQVANGDYVRAGDALTTGLPAPHDILRIKGKEDLQEFLIREVQGVYRKQSVPINDKHIEVIVAQMLSKVKIAKEGNTRFIRGSVQDRSKVVRENREIKKKGGQPATFTSLLLGISRASLSSSSFLSAASFQETTKVLTEAALAGQRDNLDGLKENIILGRLIPAGTGYSAYQDTELAHAEPEYTEEEEYADELAAEQPKPVAVAADADDDI